MKQATRNWRLGEESGKEKKKSESEHPVSMAKVIERGSFVWFLMAATQMWISILILGETTAAVETLFGTSAAAFFILGLFMFKREQVDSLNNPNKISKEVHEDMQKQQGRGVWWIILLWVSVMGASTYIF